MEIKKKSDVYVVKHLRMATYLMSLGFRLIRTHEDRNNPKFNVFIFKDTEELRKAMNNYHK